MHIRIFNHYIKLPYVYLSLIETVVLAVCAYVTVAPGAPGLITSSLDALSFQYAVVFALVLMCSTYAMGVYGSGVTEGFGSMLIRSVVSYCLLGAAAMVVLETLVQELNIGREVLFITVSSSLAIVLALRWIFYSIVDMDLLKNRILILGAGQKAKLLQQYYESGDFVGSLIVGCASIGDNIEEGLEQKVISTSDNVEHIVNRFKVDEIVVALDERRKDKGSRYPINQLLTCKLKGAKVIELVEFYERELAKIDLNEVTSSWMVFGQQFRYSRMRDYFKRFVDAILSILLMTLAWPFMLMTALAVFVESGAPIIYKQQRVGYRGKQFEIYKFRSMRQDAEKDGKAVWAKKNDNRVTKVGAFIRNTRLDELPQIVNVLKGDMSFVGPRPERQQFVQELSEKLPYYDIRHQVKPGLMGWAQLNYPYGASVEDAAEKLTYDLYYVKNHSVLLDLLIIVQSVEVILLGKGVR